MLDQVAPVAVLLREHAQRRPREHVGLHEGAPRNERAVGFRRRANLIEGHDLVELSVDVHCAAERERRIRGGERDALAGRGDGRTHGGRRPQY